MQLGSKASFFHGRISLIFVYCSHSTRGCIKQKDLGPLLILDNPSQGCPASQSHLHISTFLTGLSLLAYRRRQTFSFCVFSILYHNSVCKNRFFSGLCFKLYRILFLFFRDLLISSNLLLYIQLFSISNKCTVKMALCISVLQKHCNKNTYYVFDHHWFCSGSLRKHSACICDKILSFYCRNIFLCKYHFRFPILTPIRNKFDGLDIKRLIFFFFFFTKENYVSSHFQREIFKILSLW